MKKVDKLKAVKSSANYIACQMGASYIDTMHLVYGLMTESPAMCEIYLDNNSIADMLKYINKTKIEGGERKKTLPYSRGAERCLDKSQTPEALLYNIMLDDGVGHKALLEVCYYEDYISFDMVLDELEEVVNASDCPYLKDFPFLIDLTTKDYATDPAIAREDEIRDIEMTLLKVNKPNVVLVGEPGVGKTAIVEGLALKIKNEEVCDQLKGYKILSCNTSSLVAGTKYRGEFEEKINKLCTALKGQKVVLFLDELHTTVNAGGAEGAINMANILKPYLARGEIKVIGATTMEEYKTYMKDAAYNRRFTPVYVDETTATQTNRILEESLPKFEQHYGITIKKKLLIDIYHEAKELRGLFPDKAIDLLEATMCDAVYNKKKEIKSKDIEQIAYDIKKKQQKITN